MQWLILVMTFVVAAILERLARVGGIIAPLEARATLSLGFLLFTAYVGGGIAQRSRLRLPRIVGYLIVGFVVGPGWLSLIHADEVQALSPIANGALALIALAAGCQLDVRVLREPRGRAMLRRIGGAMAIPFALVTVVAVTVSPWFPLTAHQPLRDALALALALGAAATIVSPTTTLALVTDLGAKGPLVDTTVDHTIVQSIASVVLVIVVLAIAQPLAARGAVTPAIALHAVLLLVGSLAIGAVFAFVAIQYARVVRARYVEWALVIAAFIVAQVVRLAHFDPVLTALTAGITLRNVDPRAGERLRDELKRCAIPIYVVFFALAGAGLTLDALNDMWPWALLFIGLRIHGLRWGFRWSGGVGESWLGLISQGGLALTVAAVLRRAFPESNVSLEALLVAIIGVHQVAGPLCFQWALRRSGDAAQREADEPRAPETVLAVSSGNSGL